VASIGPNEHRRIEELLAGYALRSLSGEDAVEADRALSTHVPNCASCRETLLAFSATAAELAFVVAPVDPPETLLPRLHRELEPRGRRSIGRWTGVAAGVAAVVIAGVALSQGMRLIDLERRNELVNEVLRYIQRPGADTDRLVATGDESDAPMSQVAAPDAGFFYLVGTDVPPPPLGGHCIGAR
jgi:predicted anti-sigma-YlaC factor YlaD